MNGLDYQRLAYLGDRMRSTTATKAEKDEYMLLLFRNQSITEVQYKDYVAGRNSEEILNAALAVGAVVLIGFLLEKLFSR